MTIGGRNLSGPSRKGAAVPAGLYQGRVTVAGTKTVATDTGEILFRDGEIRTIVAVDPQNGDEGFGVVVLEDKN